MRTRERHWMETLGATLNSNRAIISDQEIKQYKAKYYSEHVSDILEKQKIYNAAHTEEIKKKMKNHYAANVDKIKAQKTERIICQCGIEHTRGNKIQHLRSAKHIAAMAAL